MAFVQSLLKQLEEGETRVRRAERGLDNSWERKEELEGIKFYHTLLTEPLLKDTVSQKEILNYGRGLSFNKDTTYHTFKGRVVEYDEIFNPDNPILKRVFAPDATDEWAVVHEAGHAWLILRRNNVIELIDGNGILREVKTTIENVWQPTEHGLNVKSLPPIQRNDCGVTCARLVWLRVRERKEKTLEEFLTGLGITSPKALLEIPREENEEQIIRKSTPIDQYMINNAERHLEEYKTKTTKQLNEAANKIPKITSQLKAVESSRRRHGVGGGKAGSGRERVTMDSAFRARPVTKGMLDLATEETE